MTTIDEWIDAEYLTTKRVASLTKEYAKATPFHHIALGDILQKERYAQLNKALSRQSFSRKEADLFSFQQTGDLTASKNPIIKSFIKLLRSKEFAKLLYAITGITTAGKADAAGFIYDDTDHLLCHDDGLSSRRIAYVMYFSTLGKKNGGALALYANKNHSPTRVVKRLQPKENTLVLFGVSDVSHHSVEEVIESRRITIAGWLHG